MACCALVAAVEVDASAARACPSSSNVDEEDAVVRRAELRQRAALRHERRLAAARPARRRCRASRDHSARARGSRRASCGRRSSCRRARTTARCSGRACRVTTRPSPPVAGATRTVPSVSSFQSCRRSTRRRATSAGRTRSGRLLRQPPRRAVRQVAHVEVAERLVDDLLAVAARPATQRSILHVERLPARPRSGSARASCTRARVASRGTGSSRHLLRRDVDAMDLAAGPEHERLRCRASRPCSDRRRGSPTSPACRDRARRRAAVSRPTRGRCTKSVDL